MFAVLKVPITRLNVRVSHAVTRAEHAKQKQKRERLRRVDRSQLRAFPRRNMLCATVQIGLTSHTYSRTRNRVASYETRPATVKKGNSGERSNGGRGRGYGERRKRTES